jgi:PmbA protein
MTLEEARAFVLQEAKKRGIKAELLFQEKRERSYQAFQGRLEEAKEARQRGLGLRVEVEGRVGYAYTEELSPEALAWALEEARENALLSGKEGFLPPGAPLGRHDLLGEGLSAPPEAKREAALALEAALREDPRVRVAQGGYQEVEAQVALASTEGAEGAYRFGVAVLFASVVMAEGASVKQTWEVEFSREFHALEPGRTALDLRQKTARLLGARPLKTGRYRAYLEPEAFISLLMVLAPMFSAKEVLDGKSPLMGRLGQRIASPLVNLVDDPTLEKGLMSRPFDAEGTPSRRTPLVEEGVLVRYLHNSETARRLGQENTGHAFRTYKGNLGVLPTNLYLAPGSGVSPRTGVLVTEFMGVHAGANPVTGEFSLQALGLLLEDGEAHPVENFAVSGNLLELLERIEGVGQDLTWRLVGPFALGSPTVEVAELSFAGA